MLIERLRLVNFRQHEDTELLLGPGLIGLIGPNGAGKSTLLEAIAWVMYGMPAARGTRESIRRRGAPPRAPVEVELDFALGSHRYRVRRTLGSAELFLDGDPAPVANSLQAVTDRITRLLGMTRDEFFNTYFTGQKELAVMSSMGATDRAQFLARVLGYDRLRLAQERVRERKTTARATLDALRSGLPDPEALRADVMQARERLAGAEAAAAGAAAALAAAVDRHEQLRPRLVALRARRERAQALVRERDRIGVELDGLAADATRLAAVVADAEGASARLAALAPRLERHARLRAERDALDAVAAAHAERATQVGELEAVRVRQAETAARLATLAEPAALAALDGELRAAREALARVAAQVEELQQGWAADRQDARSRRTQLREQFRDVRRQLDEIRALGPDGSCPTCARPLGDEFGDVCQLLERQLDAIREDGNFYKRREEQLEAEPEPLGAARAARAAAQQALDALVARQAQVAAEVREHARLVAALAADRRRLAELEAAVGREVAAYDHARHEAVRVELRALEADVLEAARLRVTAERLAGAREELGAVAAGQEARAARREAIAAELAALGHDEAATLALEADEAAAQRARQEAELAHVRAVAERDAAAAALREVERRQDEADRRAREAEDAAAALALHHELDRAFADLRTDLNQSLRPDLADLASRFVRDLTGGRYTDLELDEQYVATLVDEGEPKPVISGGEEDIANLALRLAISQMIAERAGQPLSLLVLDEIFGSLDEERRASVVDLLRRLGDRFPQVILITHVDGLREGFDRVLRVGFDPARRVSVVRDEPVGGGVDVAA